MRLIRLKEVIHCTGFSRSSVYKYVNDGNFPKPVPLGGRAVAWIESEVQEWLEDKITERQEALNQ